jgi:hypothetical protein
MFTFNGRDAHRNLTALRLHLPTKAAVAEILPEREKTEDDEADPALQRLPAPGLRGTWARAYALLTRLVSQIGWDELLKSRSAVFVMEEEYRMQKAQADIAAVTRDDTDTEVDADDDASTKGVHASTSASQVDSPTSSASESPTIEFVNDTEVTIPTIRISTESAREETLREQKAAAAATVNGVENINGDPVPEGLQQPVQAAAGEGNGENKDASPGAQESFSFSNKRLCERWLDNLFMVLYEVSPVPRCCVRFVASWRLPIDHVPGPARLDDLPCGGRALQNSARGVSQDRLGMGDPRRPRPATASQRGGKGGVPARVGHPSVLGQAVGKAGRHVRGRRRLDEDAAGRHSRRGLSVRRVF